MSNSPTGPGESQFAAHEHGDDSHGQADSHEPVPLAKVDAVGTGAVRACDDEEGENGARPAQDPNSKQRPFTPPRVPGEIVPRQLRNPHLFQVPRDIGQVLFSHSRSRFTDRWASPRW